MIVFFITEQRRKRARVFIRQRIPQKITSVGRLKSFFHESVARISMVDPKERPRDTTIPTLIDSKDLESLGNKLELNNISK